MNRSSKTDGSTSLMSLVDLSICDDLSLFGGSDIFSEVDDDQINQRLLSHYATTNQKPKTTSSSSERLLPEDVTMVVLTRNLQKQMSMSSVEGLTSCDDLSLRSATTRRLRRTQDDCSSLGSSIRGDDNDNNNNDHDEDDDLFFTPLPKPRRRRRVKKKRDPFKEDRKTSIRLPPPVVDLAHALGLDPHTSPLSQTALHNNHNNDAPPCKPTRSLETPNDDDLEPTPLRNEPATVREKTNNTVDTLILNLFF